MQQSTLAQKATNANGTLLTYQNPDLGLTMQYPSNWIKQVGNLGLNTVAAFELKQQQFGNGPNFANITLAEVDLRVYPAPPGETAARLNMSDVSLQNQAVISHYKNSTTTLGGLQALKIVSYLFSSVTDKAMQVWAFVPSKNVLVELIYITQPPQYPLYLPTFQKMVDSVRITS